MNSQRWFKWIVLVICIDHSYCLQQGPPQNWLSCSLSGISNCSYSRMRSCLAVGSYGILCTNQENIYELIANLGCGMNCLNSSYWKNETITQTCHGDCYDATRIYQYDCDAMDSNNCKITSKVRCYNNQSCSGIWTPQSALNSCSKSCGSGFQLSTAVCRNSSEIPYELSHNCPGTGGIINQTTTINATCNTHPCPAWSAWSESKPCSKTCNNGTRFLSSTCMYMNASSLLCSGSRNNSTRSKEEYCNIGLCDAHRHFIKEWYFPFIIVMILILIGIVVAVIFKNNKKEKTETRNLPLTPHGRGIMEKQSSQQKYPVNTKDGERKIYENYPAKLPQETSAIAAESCHPPKSAEPNYINVNSAASNYKETGIVYDKRGYVMANYRQTSNKELLQAPTTSSSNYMVIDDVTRCRDPNYEQANIIRAPYPSQQHTAQPVKLSTTLTVSEPGYVTPASLN